MISGDWSSDVCSSDLDVELPAGLTNWLPAQQHSGENIGETETHVMFIELKEPAAGSSPGGAVLGPEG